ncbi:ABC transporter substrate-binding protein [Leucobacter sp. CSA2]|uniref:ABC transporter substrate-binding protein n=1 Tax=Leucobacter edaphi TaxID=2796472 RepID=A0A934QE43_9MICO|nr:ABC transporter substrate-binding protein [Leucobacter edaphi]MBK0421572.1 ABC transporter substrate-binding protein [Leucobacter edaphi]
MKIARPRTAITLSALAMGALLLTACSNPTDARTPGEGADQKIVVSSANFVTSEVVGNVYAEALRAAEVPVETRFNVGSREAYVPALKDGSIDLIPDFTGNLLLFLDKDAKVSSTEEINTQLAAALEKDGLEPLDPAPAEDKDALVVTEKRAKEWKLRSISDLAAHNSELRIASAPEFKERPVGLPGLAEHYGVVPKQFVAISDGGGPATLKALLDGNVDAANIYTASASIPANHLVILEDPKFNFPSQNVVPVINKKKASPHVKSVLNEVSKRLTTTELIALNELVTGTKKLEPTAAAKQWLESQGLG